MDTIVEAMEGTKAARNLVTADLFISGVGSCPWSSLFLTNS